MSRNDAAHFAKQNHYVILKARSPNAGIRTETAFSIFKIII